MGSGIVNIDLARNELARCVSCGARRENCEWTATGANRARDKMGTIMEMRRMSEAIEKERRHLLKPTWTKDSRDLEDLQGRRGYTTKLGDCHAMHRWNVQRDAKPAVSPNHRPGQLSQKVSVLSELAQGVSTELSKFQVPGTHSRRVRVSLQSKPTVHHRSVANIDPRTLDEHSMTKLHELGRIPPLPPPPPIKARGPQVIVGTAARSAAAWSDGTRALSTWELGPRGERTAGIAAARKIKLDQEAQEALSELLKVNEKRGRRRGRPKDEIDGAAPRHPLQNPQASLRGNCPRWARPPEQCDAFSMVIPAVTAEGPPRGTGGPPSWFGWT